MKRIDRLMGITLLLRSRRKLTARQLAQIFEVSIRTIYRDIQSLCRAKIPIAVESGPDGGYSILKTYSLPPVMFTLDEAIALFLGGRFIDHLHGTPFREAMKTALIKIEDILSEEVRLSVQLLSQSVLFDMKDAASDSVTKETFERINEAILKRKCIQMVYRCASEDQIIRRTVRPYGLVYDQGMWYLIASCHIRGGQEMFHVNRIQVVALTDRHFELPDAFNLKLLARTLAESTK